MAPFERGRRLQASRSPARAAALVAGTLLGVPVVVGFVTLSVGLIAGRTLLGSLSRLSPRPVLHPGPTLVH